MYNVDGAWGSVVVQSSFVLFFITKVNYGEMSLLLVLDNDDLGSRVLAYITDMSLSACKLTQSSFVGRNRGIILLF